MQNRIFVVPYNSLENKTIIEMLQNMQEEVIITNQGRSADWCDIDSDIRDSVGKHVANGDMIYGVGMKGGLPLDFSYDGRIGSDTGLLYNIGDYSKYSKTEIVSDIIDHELNRWEQLVATGHRWGDKGLLEIGASQEEIDSVYKAACEISDMLNEKEEKAERAAEKAINDAQYYGQDRRDIIVRMPDPDYATVRNMLLWEYDNLLVISDNGESRFFGSRSITNELKEHFEGSLAGDSIGLINKGWRGCVPPDEVAEFVAGKYAEWGLELMPREADDKETCLEDADIAYADMMFNDDIGFEDDIDFEKTSYYKENDEKEELDRE